MTEVTPRFSAAEAKTAEQQIEERGKRIEYFTTEFSIEILAKKMRDREYVVPDYQRDFTWRSSGSRVSSSRS